MKIILLRPSVIMIIFMVMGLFAAEPAPAKDFPFRPGEKMSFEVRWAGILAGEAFIELLPVEDFNGIKFYHFVFTARTSPFVDVFYKVRDRIDSYTDTEMSHSFLYIKKHEGKSQKETIVEFDWGTQKAKYSVRNGEEREPISIMPGTFDPLSVFYAFRLHDLDTQMEYGIPLTDGKERIIGKVKVIKREDIKVGSLTYDAFLVEPEMEHIGGVFEKSSNAKLQIWVTADNRRIPIRIKSKVKVGSFVAELVSYEDGLTEDAQASDIH
jgi:hypothetical protein